MKWIYKSFVGLAIVTCCHAQGDAPPRKYGSLVFPAKGNIHLGEGTVEMWFINGFDTEVPQEQWTEKWRTLFALIFPTKEKYAIFFPSPNTMVVAGYVLSGEQSYVWSPQNLRWKPGELHYLAWTWRGKERDFFVDGEKLVGVIPNWETTVPEVREVQGTVHGNLEGAVLNFGGRGSSIALAGIRISSIALTKEDVLRSMEQGPVKDISTLLLDRCDGAPSEVISGYSGEKGGSYKGVALPVETKFGKGTQLWSE